jgi:hypothetical protein
VELNVEEVGSQNTNDQMEMQVDSEGLLLTESQNTEEMPETKRVEMSEGRLRDENIQEKISS